MALLETLMTNISPFRLGALILLAPLVLSVLRTLVLSRTKLPKGAKPLPGPKGLPIVGNAFDIPKTHAWLKFKQWSDEFGPIYQVKAFGTTLVVISRESIANDLLGLRGAIYSDRPPLVMAGLIADNGFLGAARWGDYWRKGRRFAQTMLSTNMIQQSLPKQTIEARQAVVDLAREPTKYAYWLERAGVMTSIKQIYGIAEKRGSGEEHHVHEICSYMEEIERVTVPGAYAVEFMPWLMHLPVWLAPFKKEANTLMKRHWDYLSPLMRQETQKTEPLAPGVSESFAGRYFKSKEDWDLTDREMVWVLSSIYGGASGTSATAMQSIILNLCLFPEWQQQIQEELETAIGGQRLPDFDDFGSLPVLRAVIKETMRWRPVLSGGFPHSVIKDDIYHDFFIPKGAVIIPNQWAIMRAEDLYPDPESFRPERWLEPKYPTYQEPLSTYPNLKRFAAFGHGRRICPGLEVTEKALFLEASSLLWACNVKKEEGASLPWYDYTGASISTPRKFRFVVEERAPGRLKMMEEAARTDHADELS